MREREHVHATPWTATNSNSGLYKRDGSPYWYYNVYREGKRIRKCLL